MIQDLKNRNVRLEWITSAPPAGKRVALLIPQYNEASTYNLRERMHYFSKVAEKYKEQMDVILIDDGSTDNSLQQMTDFINCNPDTFYLAAVYPNAQKVGALFLTAQAIDHGFVILSDFDTDIKDLCNLWESLSTLNSDPLLMGCYFRMIPHEGNGKVFLLQQLEYAFARMYYRFHEPEQSVPVMPGAGSCYKRQILLDIYHQHSGLRSGEDREATLIGLKLGYKTVYKEDVEALTRPPLSFIKLLYQRKRWSLGYFETFMKERRFYAAQMMKPTRIGLRALKDVIAVTLLLLIPLEIVILFSVSPILLGQFAVTAYLLSLVYYGGMLLSSPREVSEIKYSKIQLVLLYPFFWLTVSFFAWWSACLAFRKQKKNAMIKVKNKQIATTLSLSKKNVG